MTLTYLVLEQVLPWYPSAVAAPLVIWQKVLGQLVVDGLGLGRTLEVRIFLHEQLHILLQQSDVDVGGVLLEKKIGYLSQKNQGWYFSTHLS